MKFIIAKHILSKPLEMAAKALSGKTTIPILTEILFQVDSTGLTLIAGDTEVSIKGYISADKFEIIQSGSITLPGKKITEIVKKLDGDISIDTEGLNAIVRSGKSNFEITGMDPEEYPKFLEVNGDSIVMAGDVFKKLVTRTVYAVSKQGSTPILTGIRFDISEDKLQLTACDRHRMAYMQRPIEGGFDFSIVIGGESLKELVNIISDKDQVELTFQSNFFLVKTNEYTFVSRILDGTYPDTNRLIPTKFETEITVSTMQFLEALDRVDIIAKDEKTNLIKMTVGSEVEIFSKADNGKVLQTLDIIKREGNGLTISYNAKFAIDALKAIDSDETIIQFVGDMKPIILKGVNDESSFHLILPYRTTT